jgi:hypothetical protein
MSVLHFLFVFLKLVARLMLNRCLLALGLDLATLKLLATEAAG